jgi:hypothetical protein
VRRRWIVMLVVMAISVTVGWAILRWSAPTPPPGDPQLERWRLQLIAAADTLAAIEMQRFVPPAEMRAPDGTLTGHAPIDRYSLQLENNAQRLTWQTRIGVGLAIVDLRTASTPVAYGKAAANLVSHCIELDRVLAQVPVEEYNEAQYVAEMRGLVQQIEGRITGRRVVTPSSVPAAVPASRQP